MRRKKIAEKLFLDALDAQHPSKLVDKAVSIGRGGICIEEEQRETVDKDATYIVAVGKASRPMAASLKTKLGVRSSNICCITPDQNADESYSFTSSHPIPDQMSKKAAEKLINFVGKIPAHSLTFFALSGGASALICKPADEIPFDEINAVNRMLLESGANIEAINGVRKHLSAVKGGQLLSYFNPDCALIDLVISDVPSDNLEIIGSGLTTPDPSTFQDAYDTLLRYELWERSPDLVRTHIEKGLTGEVPETIKPGHDLLQHHTSHIIGSAKIFALKIAEEAKKNGFHPWVADTAYNKPVGKIADAIARKITDQRRQNTTPVALIFYGESTVKVTGEGKGGRNQELALRGALKIEGMNDVTWFCAGTDGIDGPTDAAGAVVNGTTIARTKKRGLDAGEFLRRNDSYHFHEQAGTLFKTGPTGNNVMDVVIVLIERFES